MMQYQMRLIPGGTFLMGSPEDELHHYEEEGPQHQVTVPTFFMSRYPVTQAQYQKVMGTNPAARYPDRFVALNKPVIGVSWVEAVEFCKRLSNTQQTYRLPTEAEWEYACRAGTTTPFHFGPTITTDLANYNGSSSYDFGPKGQYRRQTTEVDSFPANAFGLYDMHGNVREWCQDTWHSDYEGAPTDGRAWISGLEKKVIRGGGWSCLSMTCRSSFRFYGFPTEKYSSIGFRVVSDYISPFQAFGF
jgi:formylglycine-generating enzyme required for sulfatase activity